MPGVSSLTGAGAAFSQIADALIQSKQRKEEHARRLADEAAKKAEQELRVQQAKSQAALTAAETKKWENDALLATQKAADAKEAKERADKLAEHKLKIAELTLQMRMDYNAGRLTFDRQKFYATQTQKMFLDSKKDMRSPDEAMQITQFYNELMGSIPHGGMPQQAGPDAIGQALWGNSGAPPPNAGQQGAPVPPQAGQAPDAWFTNPLAEQKKKESDAKIRAADALTAQRVTAAQLAKDLEPSKRKKLEEEAGLTAEKKKDLIALHADKVEQANLNVALARKRLEDINSQIAARRQNMVLSKEKAQRLQDGRLDAGDIKDEERALRLAREDKIKHATEGAKAWDQYLLSADIVKHPGDYVDKHTGKKYTPETVGRHVEAAKSARQLWQDARIFEFEDDYNIAVRMERIAKAGGLEVTNSDGSPSKANDANIAAISKSVAEKKKAWQDFQNEVAAERTPHVTLPVPRGAPAPPPGTKVGELAKPGKLKAVPLPPKDAPHGHLSDAELKAKIKAELLKKFGH